MSAKAGIRQGIRQQFFTLANQLTFLRLALIPFFVLALVGERYPLALGLFLVAGLSDALDGILARWLKQRTTLGAYLDPITDKLLLSTSFVVLAAKGVAPWTLTILVLSRDVLILVVAMVIVLQAGFRPFSPSLYGKTCTVSEVLTVLALLLVQLWPASGWLLWAQGLLIWLTAVLAVWSGLHYGYRTARTLADLPSPS